MRKFIVKMHFMISPALKTRERPLLAMVLNTILPKTITDLSLLQSSTF